MVEALEPVREALDAGRWARTVSLGDESRQTLRQLSLLTMKPVIYACNVAEEHLANAMDHPLVQRVAEVAREEGADLVPVSAVIEAELSQLDPAEAAEYLASLGVTGSGLDKLIQATYRTLDLITYFTAGEKEVRAWTIRRGTMAPGAAGVIHSDFERGFIRAEVIGYDDLVRAGSESAAKDAGVMRLEGKAYEVRDGDVMHFRFNV